MEMFWKQLCQIQTGQKHIDFKATITWQQHP